MRKIRLTLVLALGAVVNGVPAAASAGPQPAAPQPAIAAPADVFYPGTIQLDIDATDIAHRVFAVNEVVPVEPGPLTLLYPEWIPGHHSPTGPIDKLAGLVATAGGARVEWKRDPGDVHAFHFEVPAGATELELRFEFLSPQDREQGRIVVTPEMLNLQWNSVALYPAGYFVRDIRVAASLTLPAGWELATALPVAGRDGDQVRFEPIDFENLVDSPVYAGRYAKRIDLAPGAKVPIVLNLFADEQRDLEATPEQIEVHRALVRQMLALYGARHFDRYDFLLALSDKLSKIGLEHHRSSENGVPRDYFAKWDEQWLQRSLLPHEFNHSWNGKYRRPAELWTPNYNVAMRDPELWVYEGQTQYWGWVMSARSGLWNREQTMDYLASTAARYDRGRPGMAWRTIQDTTNDPTIAERASLPFRNYQMSEDYYSGGALIWFAVDAQLRRLTGNERSLDDFARAFFGTDDGAWDVATYTFDDVVATLAALAPFDWSGFLRSRLDGHGNLAQGLADEGWRLVYDDRPSLVDKAVEVAYKTASFLYSLGFEVGEQNAIVEVLWNGPAYRAGVAPSMTLVAVDGREYSSERLEQAIVTARTSEAPIELLVKEFDTYRTIPIDYRGGLLIPHLERIDDQPDYLGEVLAARDDDVPY